MTDTQTAPDHARSVLVTGATTPIGRALIHRLLSSGVGSVIAVVGPNDRDTGLPEDPRLVRIECNLARPRSLWRLLFGPAKHMEVDTVVWLASHRRAPSGRKNRLRVDATRRALLLCERHPTIRTVIVRSYSDVYALSPRHPVVMDESHPVDDSPDAPDWRRERVRNDLFVCTRMGMSSLRLAVLRCAECFAPDCGSETWDWVQSRLCMRPVGYDPIINMASVDDVARAFALAVDRDDVEGIFNIPGGDTLPLSQVAALSGRINVAVPGPLLRPLYLLRAATTRNHFHYATNARRFHVNAVLDGTRAKAVLGYAPEHPIEWVGGIPCDI